MAGQHPLGQFQRGYYQCTVQVSSAASGGTLVRVSAKITAWYAAPDASKSGYQELPSNGRIESDFLDQLGDALKQQPAASAPAPVSGGQPANSKSKMEESAPAISAPTPQDTVPGEPIGAARNPAPSPASPFSSAAADATTSLATQRAVADRHTEELTKEAKNLEEIARNQAHPTNLAAVKKSGTPVLVNPNEGAKVLFLAAAEDEFEILDMNASWVHVRISGLSRGWIRRASLEMPPDPASETKPAEAAEVKAGPSNSQSSNPPPFQVENEQTALFPGDWSLLRGQIVKIVTVQVAANQAAKTNSQAKLAFAKSLFDRVYAELKQESSTAAGVVVIFDAADGGMVATTVTVLRQWKAESLSDVALWRRCYFDPPEMFNPQQTP